jgi:hypothetical protein
MAVDNVPEPLPKSGCSKNILAASLHMPTRPPISSEVIDAKVVARRSITPAGSMDRIAQKNMIRIKKINRYRPILNRFGNKIKTMAGIIAKREVRLAVRKIEKIAKGI